MGTAKQGLVRTGWMLMDKGSLFPKGLYSSHSVAMRHAGRASDYAVHVIVTEPTRSDHNSFLDGWTTEDGDVYMRKTRHGGVVEISLVRLIWSHTNFDGVFEEHNTPCTSLESLMTDIRSRNGWWDHAGGWENE